MSAIDQIGLFFDFQVLPGVGFCVEKNKKKRMQHTGELPDEVAGDVCCLGGHGEGLY